LRTLAFTDVKSVIYLGEQLASREATEKLKKFVDTTSRLGVELPFTTNITDIGALSRTHHYQVIWGPRPEELPALKEGYPEALNLYYMPFSRDPDPSHDLAWWKGTHPAWILYKADRKTPAWLTNQKNVPLDISNPEVIAWQVTEHIEKARQAGYDGLAADNFDANWGKGAGVWVNGVWQDRFPPGQPRSKAWNDAEVNWATTISVELHKRNMTK
jgi:hypothetical protein